MAEVTEQQIRELAYLLWEQDGKPEGSANRCWEQAEGILRKQAAGDSSEALRATAEGAPTRKTRKSSRRT